MMDANGRAPVLTCRDCKACVDGCPQCDGPLLAVPRNDAAIERVAEALRPLLLDVYSEQEREIAERLFRVAEGTP